MPKSNPFFVKTSAPAEYAPDYGSTPKGGPKPKPVKSTAAKPSNPFGPFASEFNVAPLGSGGGGGGGIGDNSILSRIQSGDPAYDAMVARMYPQPATPAPAASPTAPAPTTPPAPATSTLFNKLPSGLRDRLTAYWTKIGNGAPLPSTWSDFLKAQRAYAIAQRPHGGLLSRLRTPFGGF